MIKSIMVTEQSETEFPVTGQDARPSSVFTVSCPDCGESRGGKARCPNCRYDYVGRKSFSPSVPNIKHSGYVITLYCSSGQKEGQENPVFYPSDSQVVIGRGEGSVSREGITFIGIPDSGVSRRHLSLLLGETPLCIDANSTNGTYSEGILITPGVEYQLSCPAELTVGNSSRIILSKVS